MLKNCYIPSLDGKDLFVSNTYIDNTQHGYRLNNNGEINAKKYINTLDYSLDLIKLHEVYAKIYRKKGFSTNINGKEYSKHVINVTFNYSNKEYNRVRKGLYIKFGYSYDDIELTDCVCIKDNELIAIQTYEPLGKKDKNRDEWESYCSVKNPLDKDLLGKYFKYEDGAYKAKGNINTLNNVADIRSYLYNNGFICDGIKYVRWKRSSGSGRIGKCLFINEKLYRQIHKWEMCGIDIKKGAKIDLAALEAYISLTLIYDVHLSKGTVFFSCSIFFDQVKWW